jgi:GNAT superfamily N-acetyltransferase
MTPGVAESLAEATARIAARLAALTAPGSGAGPGARPGTGPGSERRHLRPVRDDDAPALLGLVGAAYDEFDCGPLDPEVFDVDLTAPATSAREHGRRWWVVTDADDAPVASVAHSAPRLGLARELAGSPLPTVPPGKAETGTGTTIVELHRLYLSPGLRGQGVASALVAGVAEEARLLGARRLIAWSDTRLVAAHVRYLALGFHLARTSRRLDDPAGTTEVRFDLTLTT